MQIANLLDSAAVADEDEDETDSKLSIKQTMEISNDTRVIFI